MAALRSFVLTFEDGRIRAIREPRKCYIRKKNVNSEFQNSDVFRGVPPYPPPQPQGWGVGYMGGRGVKGDFRETIPAYLNFAAAHIFFIYPRKLSYSM